MRRMILFRHGKAEVAGPSGGDKDRPLAGRGREDSAVTAGWLSDAGFVPDIVLVSPAHRTAETWDCARPAFPSARAERNEDLYLASSDLILDAALEALGRGASVMIVGHNPGLQELGADLAAAAGAPADQIDRIEEAFPTASACVFRMDGDQAAVLEAVYEPPRRAGEPPRWVYLDRASGDPA